MRKVYNILFIKYLYDTNKLKNSRYANIKVSEIVKYEDSSSNRNKSDTFIVDNLFNKETKPCDLMKYINECITTLQNDFKTIFMQEVDKHNRGIETNYIVINKNKDGKYQLMDGFYNNTITKLVLSGYFMDDIKAIYNICNNYQTIYLKI